MYLGRLGYLGNGNGNGDPPPEPPPPNWLVQVRDRVPPAIWTAQKLGIPYPNVGRLGGMSLNVWSDTQIVKASPLFYAQATAGWPMWTDYQFAQKVAAIVPTAQETAVAFVTELQQLAPAPPTTGPTVIPPPMPPVTPGDVLSPPPPAPQPLPITEATPAFRAQVCPPECPPGTDPMSLMDRYAAQTGQPMPGTTPVDSQYLAPPPVAAMERDFPLMRQYEQQREAIIADVTPPEAMPPEEKPRAGIGTVLLLAAPLLLTQL